VLFYSTAAIPQFHIICGKPFVLCVGRAGLRRFTAVFIGFGLHDGAVDWTVSGGASANAGKAVSDWLFVR
jgi:hypothetical protein